MFVLSLDKCGGGTAASRAVGLPLPALRESASASWSGLGRVGPGRPGSRRGRLKARSARPAPDRTSARRAPLKCAKVLPALCNCRLTPLKFDFAFAMLPDQCCHVGGLRCRSRVGRAGCGGRPRRRVIGAPSPAQEPFCHFRGPSERSFLGTC